MKAGHVKMINDNMFKLVSEQNEFIAKFEDVRNYKINEDDDLINIFIQSAVKLKTEVNLNYVKKACAAEGIEFTNDMVKIGKYNLHAFVLTVSLKLFIKWYKEKYDNLIMDFVQANLLKKKDELFFDSFSVDFDNNDHAKAESIIDALCVKFYQEIILILQNYFLANHQVLEIGVSEDKKSYTFKFRNMNIMEVDQLNKKVN